MVHVLLGSVDCSNRLQWLRELGHLGVEESEFQHILRQKEGHIIRLTKFTEPFEEAIRRALTYVKVKCVEYLPLHFEDLFWRVIVTGDVNEVLKGRWINLFVLCYHQKWRYANKLHFFFRYFIETAVPVKNIDREEEWFGPKFEVEVKLNQPINECGTNRLVNFLLLCQHVARIRIPFLLHSEHVFVDLLAKLGHVVHVAKCCPVYFLDLIEYLIIAALVEHLKLLL